MCVGVCVCVCVIPPLNLSLQVICTFISRRKVFKKLLLLSCLTITNTVREIECGSAEGEERRKCIKSRESECLRGDEEEVYKESRV